MFDDIDRAYYRKRATELSDRARNTIDPAIADTHRKLADRYVRLAEGDILAGRQMHRLVL